MSSPDVLDEVTELAIVIDLTSLINIEAIAEVYTMQIERTEFVHAVAAGTPASEAFHKIRHRRPRG